MNLTDGRCTPGAHAIDAQQADALMRQLPGWAVLESRLVRTYRFRNYHETIAFVNALAWIAHTEDHHPELAVAYASCTVRYNTHSAGGALSLNDFICAAKADVLYDQRGASA